MAFVPPLALREQLFSCVPEIGTMTKKQDSSKPILMAVEPWEAEEGAPADVYRPLSKEEASHISRRKAFWLVFLFLFIAIGIAIQIMQMMK
jgi:hypothetical protein